MANKFFKSKGPALPVLRSLGEGGSHIEGPKVLSRPAIPTKGFTLMETVIALGLGMITMAMVMVIFANGLQYIRAMKNSQTLNSSAASFINTASYWVKQGKIFDASSSLDILLPDNSHKILDKFLLEVDTKTTATTTFSEMAKSVRINFIMQRGSEILAATTTVAQRTF